jgi:hypothetical protein
VTKNKLNANPRQKPFFIIQSSTIWPALSVYEAYLALLGNAVAVDLEARTEAARKLSVAARPC